MTCPVCGLPVEGPWYVVATHEGRDRKFHNPCYDSLRRPLQP